MKALGMGGEGKNGKWGIFGAIFFFKTPLKKDNWR